MIICYYGYFSSDVCIVLLFAIKQYISGQFQNLLANVFPGQMSYGLLLIDNMIEAIVDLCLLLITTQVGYLGTLVT